MTQENSLWKGSPSQWLNLGPFTVALLAAGGILIGAFASGPLFPVVLIALVLPAAYLPFNLEAKVPSINLNAMIVNAVAQLDAIFLEEES